MLLSLPQLARTGDFQPIFSGLAGGGAGRGAGPLATSPEAQSKEEHSVWDPTYMSKLTITSPYVHSGVDSKHIYYGHWTTLYARVDLNPTPKSTFSPSQGIWIWPQLSCIQLFFVISALLMIYRII
jgi:hypothetical protein